MDKLVINGGKKLSGNVNISGSKNAVLPIMTATLIVPGTYKLNNVPNLRDTQTMIKLLKIIGAEVEYSNNCLNINSENCNNPCAPYELVKTMRASFYVLGPLLSRFHHSQVSLPGGCAWGPRPVDFHIKALRKMKVNIKLNQGNIVADGQPVGSEIIFKKKSVGATGNVLMAAVKAKGETKIINAAKEPEIVALGDFLVKLGAKIEGLGTNCITITPIVKEMNNIEFDILAGGETAGIPYASFLSERMQKKMIYIRKKPKEFGKTQQIEGSFNSKDKVILIEDLATDGGSKALFVEALRNSDLIINDIFVIFFYNIFKKSREILSSLNVNMHYLCTWKNIINILEKNKKISTSNIESLKFFLNNPEKWRLEN